MIGFLTTLETAQAINDAVAVAQTSRGLPVYWLPSMVEIVSGPRSGMWLVPADDQLLATPLRGTPPLTPVDFPEFPQLIAMLGGLESRVELQAYEYTKPQDSEL
jgi:hypothetical protein